MTRTMSATAAARSAAVNDAVAVSNAQSNGWMAGPAAGRPGNSLSTGETRAISIARATAVLIPSRSSSLVDAMPTRLPTTARTFRLRSRSMRFSWITLCVMRDRARSCDARMSSVSSAFDSASARSRTASAAARSEAKSAIIAHHAHVDVAEPRRRRALARSCGLHRLAFAAVRCAPRCPCVLVADRIARAPKLRRHAGVRGIFEHLSLLAVLDLVAELTSELEVQAFVVDGPRAVALHVDAVLDTVEELGLGCDAGLQIHIADADHGQAAPVLRAHAAAQVDFCGRRRVASCHVADE